MASERMRRVAGAEPLLERGFDEREKSILLPKPPPGGLLHSGRNVS